jgi:hypothetical protein
MASWVRKKINLAGDQSIEDLREVAAAACGRSLLTEGDQDFPEGQLLALVGWKTGGEVPVVSTRALGEAAARRFLWARSVYLALRGARQGPRLVTDAKTWWQRASRAFGAELLAPRAGVRQRYHELGSRFGSDVAEERVAAHYEVSPTLVQHQLQNA